MHLHFLIDPSSLNKSRLGIHSSLFPYSHSGPSFSTSVLSIPRKKPPKLDDGRSNNCLEAMRSSSPPRKKILKEVNIDVSSDDANVAYLSWMIEIFLDYDGTLSPIVDDPDRAFMSNEVYELVGLPELYYAGSHGMDIMLPVENTLATNDANCIKATDQQGKEVNLFQLARKFLSMIDEVFRTLVKKTKDIKVQKLRTISFVPVCITVM
ncbi:hypothetical protein CQW23_23700 [Capsicum baccatum]|uniref:Trehalose 6-phosphate phosphatase n=1 Tax=Capsicum baccatum TaxID=33114 RepID=A0A2G2VSP0_CAPBA|nr:hypothetical protein CQW23_23700 [Capsicum baccatum]